MKKICLLLFFLLWACRIEAAELATDAFTGTDGTNPPNANWTTVTGEAGLVIQTNAIQTSGVGADSAGYRNDVTWPADQYSNIQVLTLNTANTRAVCVLVRVQSGADSFYRGCARGPLTTGTFTMQKTSAGTTTTLSCSPTSPVTQAIAANDYIDVAATGTGTVTLEARVGNSAANARSATAFTSCTDSSSPFNSGSAGAMIFVDTGSTGDARGDNWSGGSVVTSSPPPYRRRIGQFPFSLFIASVDSSAFRQWLRFA